MKLNRAELRKTMYDFNSISNRLIQASYEDYTSVIKKFVVFIKDTPIIYDFVLDCGTCQLNLEQEFKKVQAYYCDPFPLGETNKEEICNVFAIIEYIALNNVNVACSIEGYTTSTKYQDRVRAFNDRVVMILIRHIEGFLTKVGIDMGVDEKITYNITISGGQVNIANDNSTITATNINGLDADKLTELINCVKKEAPDITGDDAQTLYDGLEVIEEETKAEKPKKSILRTAIVGLKAIKGTAEFGAAIAALIQFIQPLLQ